MHILGTGEEEVEYGFFDPETTVGAVRGWSMFDLEESLVQGNVACSELCEQASLVVAKLINDVKVICGGEQVVNFF